MIRRKFGIRCRELRKSLTNLSQEGFANSIDMDRTYYSSVENGERNLSLLNIAKIAKGFGISLKDLFDGLETLEDE